MAGSYCLLQNREATQVKHLEACNVYLVLFFKNH